MNLFNIAVCVERSSRGGGRVLNVGAHAQLVPGVGGSFLPETLVLGY